MATDLANDLVRDNGWNEDQHMSPHQHLLEDNAQFVHNDVPIAPAAELAVKLPREDTPKVDCYIDDIFSVFLEEDV
jgi:hypothetical protein